MFDVVDKLKLLEKLDEWMINSGGLDEILLIDNREEYFNASMKYDARLGLMERLYEELKDKFPNEKVIKHIAEFYDLEWDVHYAPDYEGRLDYAM